MILVLSDLWLPFPGGAERLMFNLSRDLLRRGHDVRVLTDYHAQQQFDGPPVHWESMGVFDNREAGARVFLDHVWRTVPNVILTHHLFAFQYERELCQLAEQKIPVVQVVLNTRRIACASLGVFISEFTKQTTPGARPGDLVITPPAFDDVISPLHGDAIGFIKPIPHKGVELFYEIAARMPWRQFVVLRGEWQDIEVIRDDLPNVEYMEPVDDIRDFYRRVCLVLMPSVSEDAGTVAQECTLNGLPCISSDVGGLAETNAGGIRVHSRSAEEWTWAIEQLLNDPGQYAEVVAKQALRFTATEQTARLDKFAARVAALEAT